MGRTALALGLPILLCLAGCAPIQTVAGVLGGDPPQVGPVVSFASDGNCHINPQEPRRLLCPAFLSHDGLEPLPYSLEQGRVLSQASSPAARRVLYTSGPFGQGRVELMLPGVTYAAHLNAVPEPAAQPGSRVVLSWYAIRTGAVGGSRTGVFEEERGVRVGSPAFAPLRAEPPAGAAAANRTVALGLSGLRCEHGLATAGNPPYVACSLRVLNRTGSARIFNLRPSRLQAVTADGGYSDRALNYDYPVVVEGAASPQRVLLQPGEAVTLRFTANTGWGTNPRGLISLSEATRGVQAVYIQFETGDTLLEYNLGYAGSGR